MQELKLKTKHQLSTTVDNGRTPASCKRRAEANSLPLVLG